MDVETSIEGTGVSDNEVSTAGTLQDSQSVHPLMTTKFEDYTVTEGLLLAILLTLVVSAVIRFIRGVF
jgi:hypothetical protein